MEKKKINMKVVQKVVTSKNKNQSKNKISNSKKKGNSSNTKKKTTNTNNTNKKNIVISKEATDNIKSKVSNNEKTKLDSNLKEKTTLAKSKRNTFEIKEPLTPTKEKKKEIVKKKEQQSSKKDKKQKAIEKSISNTNQTKKVEKRKTPKSKPQSHKQIKTKVDSTIVKDKKAKGKKIINIIVILLFIICISGLVVSASHIFVWKKENKEIEKQVTEIEQKSEVEEVPDSEAVEVIEPVEEIDKANPYWDYIKMNLINVDFTELKQTNNEVAGWIQVNGTNINYPFVQTTDNDYYLSHAFNKSYNSAGWVFMDYRNSISSFNKNTIIYAHGRLDNTMFGSLKNIIKSSWIDNPNNYIIKLSTEYENTLWQVFSVYKIPTTNDYLKINFKDEEEFTNFTNKLLSRSEHDFNTIISSTDKILTLSTCYDDTDKVVLHAKLIKREAK